MSTYSYSGDPSKSTKDQVRFLARDTKDTAMVLSDEEIAYLLAQEANVYMAAASACDMIADRGLSSKTVGETSLSFSPDSYNELAKTLRARGRTHQVPFVGGLSLSERTKQASDTDLPQRDFTRGMHDHPDAPGPR